MGLHSNRSQHVLQIENIIRFDNSAGNNNCWLNCVVRVLAHMLHAVPNLHMYQKSTNVMVDGFLQYLKNIITMKKGGLLCVDDMTVHVPGLHHLLSVKSLFSTLIHDSDFASRMQQDASEALTRILDVFQEENTTVAPFSFCEYEFFYHHTCRRCPEIHTTDAVKGNMLRVAVPEREDDHMPFDMGHAVHLTLQEHTIDNDRLCTGCNMPGVLERINFTILNTFLIVQILLFERVNNVMLKKTNTCSPLLHLEINTMDALHKFQLECIIEHVGEDMRSGHYKCYFLKNGMWYLGNDSYVTPISIEELPNQPYLCIYKKIHIDVDN